MLRRIFFFVKKSYNANELEQNDMCSSIKRLLLITKHNLTQYVLFEPRSISSSYSMIVRVFLKRTVVCD